MSKRNFILLIILLIIVTVAVFGFLYSRRTPSTLENGGSGTNFLSDFNPFGGSSPAAPNNNAPQGEDNTPNSPIEEEIQVPDGRLVKVSSIPIAGFTVYQKERFKELPIISPTPVETTTEGTTKPKEVKPTPPPTEFVPALRYVARSTGNIYQTFADKIEERKFSATLIPKIYEAYFGNRGESVIMRFARADDKTIATFAGTLPKELLGGDSSENNEVKGVFLPDNISDVSVSPDRSQIFYLLNIGESVVGITSSFLGEKKVQIFDSPFTEWLSSWPNSKIVSLTTKPASSVPGYMYAVDPSKKSLSKIISNVNGLTTLGSPDGKLVLYSNNNLSLSVYNIATSESTLLPIKTLPEKCVWNKLSTIVYCSVPKFAAGASYPDVWYQGEASFSDDIWRIDIQSGAGTLILDPVSEVGADGLDGIKLQMDESENYLFFVNKKDSYLWEFKLF